MPQVFEESIFLFITFLECDVNARTHARTHGERNRPSEREWKKEIAPLHLISFQPLDTDKQAEASWWMTLNKDCNYNSKLVHGKILSFT